jgi:hypothetical protein
MVLDKSKRGQRAVATAQSSARERKRYQARRQVECGKSGGLRHFVVPRLDRTPTVQKAPTSHAVALAAALASQLQ